MVDMSSIPVNIEEMKHRKEYEDLHNLEHQRKSKRSEKKVDVSGDLEAGKDKKFDPESSQQVLLPKLDK